MGIRVEKADNHEVCISAPFQPNINHHATVFGGTLASALLLSGWCLTEIRLNECGLYGHVVVINTELEYLRPVENDFQAVCSLGDEEKWETFLQVLKRKKKARINLEGSITTDDGVAVRFKGGFAALLENA